ncbi:helix-turn-helix domain-containing protein [Paenibacillus thalictri]|uniref:Helix-turn-helix domain-containing protein n=1 Tax=Paenibacillus thalictri TaxID=2527873 RepID=A0A4Q9DVZ2_9BACL|nr:helix-turn-helix domain-containing protein [Paenibacillus thalictri]TBL80546.1 helix-turn-helix domain-containing protein [Paenibacillus thalictri]
MINALIVDDEYIVRKGLISTLPWKEFDIHIAGEASNGEKALEFMLRHPIDLLITDLAMPVMNGFDLMRRVREQFAHIHMVVLTCHEDFKYIQEALRLGAVDYIVKTELEDDMMKDALRRIALRMGEKPEEKAKPAASEPLWSPDDEKRLQVHMNKWLPLHWTIKQELFDEFSRELHGMNPPILKLRQMMHYLLVEWNRMLGGDLLPEWLPGAEGLQDLAAWDVYIGGFRDRLRNVLQVSAYPQDVALRIMDAADFIKTNMDLNITQGELARKMGLSRGYFSKCFKDLLGKPFHDYMKELRIARAKTLLLQSSRSVADIAEECGYSDHRYFSRQFRDETGLLPSEYRTWHV